MVDTKAGTTVQYSRNRVGRAIRKYKYVQILGGKCSKCGYSKNLSALVFHHAGDKRVIMNSTHLYSNKHVTIMAELTQCELLCHNCHNELHNPYMSMKHIAKVQAAREGGLVGRKLNARYTV